MEGDVPDAFRDRRRAREVKEHDETSLGRWLMIPSRDQPPEDAFPEQPINRVEEGDASGDAQREREGLDYKRVRPE